MIPPCASVATEVGLSNGIEMALPSQVPGQGSARLAPVPATGERPRADWRRKTLLPSPFCRIPIKQNVGNIAYRKCLCRIPARRKKGTNITLTIFTMNCHSS